MKDVGSWRADEAHASLQQALMYNDLPANHASIAEPGCVTQQSLFLPCWNDNWLHAPRPEEIHGISTLVSTRGSFDQLQRPMIQLTQAASSELHEVVRGSDGLWRPLNSNSPTSPMQKLMQVEQYSHNMPGSTSRVSNSVQLGYNPLPATGKAAAAAYGASMCDKLLFHASTAGAGALGNSQFVESVLGMHAIDSVQDCSIQGLLHMQQHPQLPVVPDILGAIETQGFSTGSGFSPGGNGAAVTNMQEMQQQKAIAAGMKSFNTGLGFSPCGTEAGVTNIWEMQQPKGIAEGMRSFNTGLGFRPNGHGAAVTNIREMQQQKSIAAGTKSFNPGPYVSSAAIGEEQDVALAGCRAWLENKSNSAVPVGFGVAHQLGGSTTQHNGGLQQQLGAVASPWASRMSSIPAALPAASPVVPVLSGHTGLGGMDGKTSIVMQPEDMSDLKGALLPRCPSVSGNTLFINSHKRSIALQGDAAFQESFQNTGKNPAAGGMPWSGQGACSRLEYVSTVAHKQVSQSTACGSSRALGPVLNTNMKLSAHQGSAKNLQNIAAENAGKKPAAGGMPWSGGQGACSRLEYLSTAAHKQVSQSTASGSSRALGPALNTNLKPRARQGSANDPQSIAARVRRERISERLKYLQTLIPNGDKVDMVTMLEKAINYVQCLELQIRMLKDDSLWPKALGALPNTLEELQELAGPEIAGRGQCKSGIVESEPKVSTELMEKDHANQSSSHS